eukprot:CAMPEP_0206251288 /NCGR_PEP_ID=MMETSP0047_2-20121206/21941_1 /ASSEMBLY_ACC=CAM_ASM_000192 /TAXON_ID=195065 /ORGANISM="Chroomonas mesostigmatica_cf, Strain CCMP1168" /LENGTH=266 /DNA_ID=CAMNT_0053677225 /DNA_START=129 /DNA_END=926 /DNA_ORIENTATION=+
MAGRSMQELAQQYRHNSGISAMSAPVQRGRMGSLLIVDTSGNETSSLDGGEAASASMAAHLHMIKHLVVEYDLEKTRLPLTAEEEQLYSSTAVHKRFQLPPDEILVEDYACALQGVILLQGRMYIFPRYVCFACDLLGSFKSIKIGFHEILDIKKAKTALIIPNAVKILTPSRKFLFSSFIFRDEAHKALVSLWYIHMGTLAAHEQLAVENSQTERGISPENEDILAPLDSIQKMGTHESYDNASPKANNRFTPLGFSSPAASVAA